MTNSVTWIRKKKSLSPETEAPQAKYSWGKILLMPVAWIWAQYVISWFGLRNQHGEPYDCASLMWSSVRKTVTFMSGKNPDVYKLEDIIVCIKMFAGYYPTAHPIFILEMSTSGKWENFQIPSPWNISKPKGILRLFPTKTWTSGTHGCKPEENPSSNNAKWVKFQVQVALETRVKSSF